MTTHQHPTPDDLEHMLKPGDPGTPLLRDPDDQAARTVAELERGMIAPASALRDLMGSGAVPAPDGQSGTSRPEIAREERVQRYATALDLHSFRLASTSWQRFVLRVLAVADAEQEALRAEAERLTEAIYRQGAAIDRARMERAQAEDAETAATERAAAAEAERDRLAGIVDRVRAYSDIQRRTYAWMEYQGYTLDQITEAEAWKMPIDSEGDDPRPEIVRHLDEAAEFAHEYEAGLAVLLDSQAPTEGSQP